MPVVVAESSTMGGEHMRYRRGSRSQPISDPDLITPQIPSIIQSTRCKSTISSLLLSTLTPNNGTDNPTTDNPPNPVPIPTIKKKNFTSATFRGLGCTASSQVSVPAVIRTSADWGEAKKVRKKKQQQKKSKGPATNTHHQVAATTNLSQSSTSVEVIPDVWCGPGMAFATDASSSVDCVVSRRPPHVSGGRAKFDAEKINHRERSSCPARRMVNYEDISFLDQDLGMGMSRPRLDVYGSRHQRHVRHRSPEGLAEIVMLQSSLLMGGRSDGVDRYRDWRLDVDNMSYEELLELGDRIGSVSTGLEEEEIIRCLQKTTPSILDDLSTNFPAEMQWKCSICQEEYEADDETGKLNCGHFYHIHCIKQWLVQKKTCPVCKTEIESQQ